MIDRVAWGGSLLTNWITSSDWLTQYWLSHYYWLTDYWLTDYWLTTVCQLWVLSDWKDCAESTEFIHCNLANNDDRICYSMRNFLIDNVTREVMFWTSHTDNGRFSIAKVWTSGIFGLCDCANLKKYNEGSRKAQSFLLLNLLCGNLAAKQI